MKVLRRCPLHGISVLGRVKDAYGAGYAGFGPFGPSSLTRPARGDCSGGCAIDEAPALTRRWTRAHEETLP